MTNLVSYPRLPKEHFFTEGSQASPVCPVDEHEYAALLGQKSLPMPLNSPQTAHGLTSDRTRYERSATDCLNHGRPFQTDAKRDSYC